MGAKTPTRKAPATKKKKKKHGTDAKLQFPLLRHDDSLDDMLKEMLGEKVKVYGEMKSPANAALAVKEAQKFGMNA